MDIFKIECLMKDMTAEMIYNRFNDSGVPDNGYKSANASPGSVHRQTPSPTDSGLESDDSPGRANQGTKRIDEVSFIACNKILLF
ncbi:hypothetical protein DPMN_103438 [Dreissena polymorpha]|uniref:Uncharacterized protein n=1 Tax=Dreissena polymorpha TaxID=45954 RepID=A0A9D4H7V5_DREPO|nr:hypothetical protein DPMN_103438 [Dreissena polymorpha]